MIHVSTSYGFGPDNRYQLDQIPNSIQLALYKYDLYKDNRDDIVKTLEKQNVHVRAVHLPLDTMKTDYDFIFNMMDEIYAITGCAKYVVHPNRGIIEFLKAFNKKGRPFNLCIETFGWKSNKTFRTPLEIIFAIEKYSRHNMDMTIDTSHIEDLWFDHKIMKYLLYYTSVIHLSNRAKGIGLHLPFNDSRGQLNLVSFVRDLQYKYKWSGDIVLEYMPDYHYKLYKNLKYLERLLHE